MASLQICKGGTLIPRDPEKGHCPKPTVISYRHTIRQLGENLCNCKEEKQHLKKQFEAQLAEKDSEIIALVNRIADKESEIEILQTEIYRLKNSQTAQHTPTSKEESILQTEEPLWERMQKTLNSTVVSSFSLCDVSSNHFYGKNHRSEIQKTEREMDDCFKKTSILMSQIDGIMKKKRKYEFYNPFNFENSIIEELDNSQEKEQDETQEISMQDTFCRPMSDYNETDSLDMTTFESVQNFGQGSSEEAFYSKLIQDSILLKNTILQMKEESAQEMRELEEYYQKQLKISYEELERERNKNQLFETTKTKLDQISCKGRQALAQLDQNEGFEWDVGDKRLLKTSLLIYQNQENIQT